MTDGHTSATFTTMIGPGITVEKREKQYSTMKNLPTNAKCKQKKKKKRPNIKKLENQGNKS